MMSELEGRVGATTATSSATESNDATSNATKLSDATSSAAALNDATSNAAGSNEAAGGAAGLNGAATAAGSTGDTATETAMPAPAQLTATAAQPTTTAAQPAAAAEARDTPPLLSSPPPQEGARVRDSLEAIKTAVVWLVVLQILTILSPLLRVSIKWALVVGLVLTLATFAVGGVAYLKARRMQDNFPE